MLFPLNIDSILRKWVFMHLKSLTKSGISSMMLFLRSKKSRCARAWHDAGITLIELFLRVSICNDLSCVNPSGISYNRLVYKSIFVRYSIVNRQSGIYLNLFSLRTKVLPNFLSFGKNEGTFSRQFE